MAQTRQIEIEIVFCGGCSVVHVRGDVNWSTSPEMRAAILDLIESHSQGRLIVNLSGVRHLDSSGISSLIEALDAARKRQARFILSGLSESTRHVLAVTGLSTVFETARTVAEALK